MMKFVVLSASVISMFASAAPKEGQLIECKHVTIMRVEVGEDGKQKLAVVEPHVLRCEPVKTKTKKKKEKPERFFPRQP